MAARECGRLVFGGGITRRGALPPGLCGCASAHEAYIVGNDARLPASLDTTDHLDGEKMGLGEEAAQAYELQPPPPTRSRTSSPVVTSLDNLTSLVLRACSP